MGSINYAALAPDILDGVGGEANISSMTHCATRLRLVLRDNSKADTAKVEGLNGVVTVVQSGGQYQVVIGNDVPLLYEELGRITKFGSGAEEAPADEGGNLFNRFIKLISALINPLIWPLAGSGLLKAFVTLATTAGWLSANGSTYTILNAAGDAIFYFLPIVLAITAAKRFNANQITAVAIAGALVYPSIVALSTAGAPVTFFGIPVVMASYTSSLVPIILSTWIQGYLERWLKKVLPSAIRNFTTPLIVLFVMVPLVLMTVGPVTTYVSTGLSHGIAWLFVHVPWLAGAVMGAFWQVFVIFGVHWGFVPFILADLKSPGYSLMAAATLPAVLAQGAAMIGVMIRTRSKKMRELAGPAALSGILAGITEPGIYGVNLPLKKPFVYGCIGGAVGGAIVAIGGSASSVFVVPSLLGIPAFLQHGNLPLFFIGLGVAMVIAFLLTLILGFTDLPEADAASPAEGAAEPVAQAAAPARELAEGGVCAPVDGTIVALGDVNDKVFASGAMGSGFGVTPVSGAIHAPLAGQIVAAMDSGHAYGIKGDNGLEVLVHIGIDTVQLKGEHFDRKVQVGDHVAPGDLLAEVDMEAVAAAGYDTTVITVITNSAALPGRITVGSGAVNHGEPVASLAAVPAGN